MILYEHDIDRTPARRIPSPGKCIYCGLTNVVLTDEHVIPYAIGKNATILERSCCKVCQSTIQPYEQEVLKKQLGVFRAMVESPTRNKKDRPRVIALPLVEYDANNQVVRKLGTREVSVEEGPLILNLWQSPAPRILGEQIDPESQKRQTLAVYRSQTSKPNH